MIATYKTHLIAKKKLAQNIYLLEFILNEGTLEFQAGQYLILFVPQKNKEPIRRLYSIATPPSYSDRFELLVELVPNGIASTYFERLNTQEQIMFQGPAGLFTMRPNAFEKLFLITGTGIAPVRSMLYHNLPRSSQKFTLLWGLRYLKDVYFFEEFKALTQKYPHFQFKICLSREENLDKILIIDQQYFALGHVDKACDELLRNWKLEIGNFDYYLCGGRHVVEYLRQFLQTKGVTNDRMMFEKF